MGRPSMPASYAATALLSILLLACGADKVSEGDSGATDAHGGSAGAACSAPDCGVSSLPRNMILLLGDGMGREHWDGARIHAGRPLAIDAMRGPVYYATNSSGDVVTDSAASATAVATGHCTLNGQLGLSAEGEPLETLLELAQRAGKSTGLITNSFVIDASPMAFATHVSSRGTFPDVAEQLLTLTKPDLVFGGWITPELTSPLSGIEEIASSNGYEVAFDLAGISAAPAQTPLLGLFGRGPSSPVWLDWEWGLTPESLRETGSDEPTLEELTRFALQRLGATPNGFFLLVEDELPDTIGHANAADPTLAAELMADAVLELDRAIAAVLEWTLARATPSDTLVLVWSDHETGGYGLSDGGPLAATFSTSDHTGVMVPAYTLDPRFSMLEQVRHVSDLHAFATDSPATADAGPGCP